MSKYQKSSAFQKSQAPVASKAPSASTPASASSNKAASQSTNLTINVNTGTSGSASSSSAPLVVNKQGTITITTGSGDKAATSLPQQHAAPAKGNQDLKETPVVSKTAATVSSAAPAKPTSAAPSTSALDMLKADLEKPLDEELEQDEDVNECSNCHTSLEGLRYVSHEEKVLCIDCFESKFAPHCLACLKTIGVDSRDLSFKDKHWHEDCFKCNGCSKSLANQPFSLGPPSECVGERSTIYCSECHEERFSQRCDACCTVFKSGSRKFEYKGKEYHETCFRCVSCTKPIGTASFVPLDSSNSDLVIQVIDPRAPRVICMQCYEEKIAQKCFKCKQVLKSGGVTFKGETWHRECFICDQCKKPLAGTKFTTKDEKPYCIECHNSLFAPKCCKCQKAITSQNGSKYITYEGNQWHADCFVCTRCGAALAGKGFFTAPVEEGADQSASPDSNMPQLLCETCAS